MFVKFQDELKCNYSSFSHNLGIRRTIFIGNFFVKENVFIICFIRVEEQENDTTIILSELDFSFWLYRAYEGSVTLISLGMAYLE